MRQEQESRITKGYNTFISIIIILLIVYAAIVLIPALWSAGAAIFSSFSAFIR